MKVLRVLGLIFGILLLLTGGGLLAASYAVAKGESAIVSNSGLAGPVDGKVLDVDNSIYTVSFTAKDGQKYTVEAAAQLSKPAKVGDTVPVFYQADDPTAAVVTDALGTGVSKLVGTLRVSGFIALGVGAVLLIAAIIGFVLGKKSSPQLAPAGGAYPATAYPAQNPSYPVQNAGPPPPNPGYPQQYPGYPQQSGQPGYPQQGGQPGYPQQGGQQGQGYPPLPPYPPSSGDRPPQ